MLIRRLSLILGAAAAIAPPATADAQAAANAQMVSVIIVGGFHMANPGHDIHNLVVDDVLQPGRQAELARISDALARFRPTEVMAEWDADTASARYARYLAGTLAPSRNEVVQLGFRLAKAMGHARFYGIDADGDFPYEPVVNYAKAHGQAATIDRVNASVEHQMQRMGELLKSSGGISATLRYLNDPAEVRHTNDFYREMLRLGDGAEEPGVNLVANWYRRNFLICAQLIRNSHPGDRIVVFFGSGHGFLLRQCVTETPGFRLVEANDYLPR